MPVFVLVGAVFGLAVLLAVVMVALELEGRSYR